MVAAMRLAVIGKGGAVNALVELDPQFPTVTDEQRAELLEVRQALADDHGG